MARRIKKVGPSYRRQSSPSGDRAFVELGPGRRVYLGAYGSSESKAKYHRVVAEWESNRRRQPVEKAELRVCELLDRFLPWAQERYRKPDGKPTGTLWNYKTVIRVVRAECGALEVAGFGVPEPSERLDVPIEHVEAVKPFVSKQVWGLIQVQLATGVPAREIKRIHKSAEMPTWLAPEMAHYASTPAPVPVETP